MKKQTQPNSLHCISLVNRSGVHLITDSASFFWFGPLNGLHFVVFIQKIVETKCLRLHLVVLEQMTLKNIAQCSASKCVM